MESGTKLGPYEIHEQIGAGGMGEVYRATDTRLDRIVAIKVLPEHLASDPQRRERFEREAKAVSSLNHPHICTLHDVGEQDGTHYLVMELVEGDTLAARLEKGRLPLDQALEYAIQIADALDKAHRQGIVHRDLKPGNIMLTKSGVKLLDFGLAKLKGDAGPASAFSQMPTQDASKPLTQEGTILGTLQYMAPEQLEGNEADARTDIFAFGAVVYEMVTGKKAFEGKSQASVIAAILEREPPPPSELQPMTPPALDHMVQRCFAKDGDERWQTAYDAMRELKWIGQTGSRKMDRVPVVQASNRLAWILMAVGSLALAVAIAYLYRAPTDDLPIQFQVSPPAATTIASGTAILAVSPNVQHLAFIAIDASGNRSLWVRDIGSVGARSLPGTEGANGPFWSPDSRFIAFYAQGQLNKTSISGGSPQSLADAPGRNNFARGGTWGRNGVIVFSPEPAGPLYRVSEAGGTATTVTTLDESRGELAHNWPHFLPDGRRFLYLGRSGQPEESGLYVASLDSEVVTRIRDAGSNVGYASPGYLVFCRRRVADGPEVRCCEPGSCGRARSDCRIRLPQPG